MNLTRDIYNLSFQISPIIFEGGIAQSIPGGMLPVLQILGFAQGALTSGGASLSDFPYYFLPVLSGTKVINQSVATYPFANNQVAANATVDEPKPLSLLMVAPVKDTAGYITKLPMFTALRDSFAQHNAAGGTYTIAMPSYIFTGCIMTGVTDVTQNSKQQQIEWRIDFLKPLISLSAATQAFSALMKKISDGNKISSTSWSGVQNAIGTAAQNATSYGTAAVGAPSVSPLISQVTGGGL
jgi:hypothetical protein